MKFKRWIAYLLCICMLTGMDGMAAFAKDLQSPATMEDAIELAEGETTVSENAGVSGNSSDQEETMTEPEDEGKGQEAVPEEAVAALMAMNMETLAAAGDTPPVTRIQWLHDLVTAFQMTVDEDNYPDNYYSDLDASSEYYRDVMLATEFGLVDVEAGDPVNPEEAATREFAAHTLNLCLGYVQEEETYTFSEAETVQYPEDIQIAIEKGWFALSGTNFLPDQEVTAEEKSGMLTYAAEVIQSTVIDTGHKNQYAFSEDVIVLPEDTAAELTDENEITITDLLISLKAGDKFALIQNGFPVVRKVVEVRTEGNQSIIRVSDIPMEEAFTSFDLQGSLDMDLGQTQAVASNVSLDYIVGGTEENQWEDGEKYADPGQLGKRRVSAVEVKAEYEIPREIKQKYDLGDGMKATITCKVSNFASDYDSTWNTAFFDIGAKVDFSCNVSLDVLKEIGVAPSIELVRIPIGLVGFLKVTLDMTLKGNATLNLVEYISIGVQYTSSNGFRMYNNFYKDAFTIQAKAEANVGVKASAGVNCGFIKGEVYGKVGASARVETEVYTDDKLPSSCTHLSAWLYASIGCSVSVDILVYKGSWGKDFLIFRASNSPVRVAYHFEDGVPVSTCTRDKAEEESGTGKKRWKYYTPSYSQYGYNGSNSGVDSSGKEYAIFDYSLDNEGNATITKYNGNVSALNIPDTLDGHPVVGIGGSVFKNNSRLRIVVIPDSVTSIGSKAFENCSNLGSVTLSNKLESLGWGAFGDCDSLTMIEIPKSLDTAGNAGLYKEMGAFQYCDGLKTVVFENGITEIPDFLFANCSGLERIILPGTVTKIESHAFFNCINLREVELSNSVTYIGDSVFQDCCALKEIVIPDSVVEIAQGAFGRCTNLSNVMLSHSLKKLGAHAFFDCDKLTIIEIPKSLESTYTAYIPAFAYNYQWGPFYGCDGLKNVVFEEGTTYVVKGLFAHCSGLEEITLPQTITSIGNNAFEGCNGLVTVNFSDAITRIEACAFNDCIHLVDVKLPSMLNYMGYLAFGNCDGLINIEIPNTMREVGVTSIWLGGGPNYRDGGPFTYCDKLETVTFANGTKKITDHILTWCEGLKSVEITENVDIIGKCAFRNCWNLRSVKMANSVKKIEEYAFQKCMELSQINIPDGLDTIESFAFNGCSSLREIIVPDSVSSMGTYIFAGCTDLTSVRLPQGRKNIPEGAFQSCTNLKTVSLPVTVMFIRENAFSNSGLTEIILPDAVEIIEKNAFRNCENLVSVTYGKQIKDIGNYAFYNCVALMSVVLPDSMISMGAYCFAKCTALNEVKIGIGVTNIPAYAFDLCPSLEEIVLPYRITKVAGNAFTNCTALTEVTIPRATTVIENNAFSYPTRMTVYGITGTYAETWAGEVGATFVNREIRAEKAELNETEISVNKGQTYDLILKVTPHNFTDEVVWRSSDQDVVTVSDLGVVTAKKVGTATVRVTVGSVSASCKVTVQQPVTSIGLNKTSLTMEALDVYELTASVSPSTAANKEIAWNSSDDTIVSVDESGKVTALSKGQAVITAEAQDGSGVSRSCKVTVTNNAYRCSTPTQMESPHDYPTDCSDVWIYTQEGAKQLYVTFDSKTYVEEDFDFLYLYTKDKTLVGKYTGSELAGETVAVLGDTVRIQLVSDSAGTAWGFKVIAASADGRPEVLEPEIQALKPPVFSIPSESRIPAGTQISLTCEEADTQIFYTLDGKQPTKESLEYSVPIVVNENTTIRAYAVKDGCQDSMIVTAVYYVAGEGEETDLVPKEDIPEGGVPEGMWVAPVKPQTYTGQAIKPEIHVYDGMKRLKAGRDYTVSYKNNKKANNAQNAKTAPTILVKGKGNYKGSAKAVFEILPVHLEDERITIKDLTLAYNKKQQKSVPVITFQGKKLSAKSDFTVVYSDKTGDAYTDPGSYEIELQGKGNFCGSIKTILKITESTLMRKVRITKIPNQPYQGGNAVEPELEIYDKASKNFLLEGTDYEVRYENNYEVGTARAVISGIGSYAGTREITFKIIGTSIAGAEVRGITDRVYNGDKQTLNIQVVLNGRELSENHDYQVTYEKNVDAGTAKLTLKGIGEYTGTLRKTFKILPYDLERDTDNLITGLESEIVEKVLKGGVKPQFTLLFNGRELEANKHYTVAYKNNKVPAAPDSVKAPAIIIKGKGNFKGTITKYFTITKKDLQDPDASVQISAADVGNAGRPGKYISKPVLTDTDGKTLKAGVDYEKEISYFLEDGTVLNSADVVPANTFVHIKVTAKGNYEGTLETVYRVAEKSFSKASIKIVEKPAYTGQAVCLDEKNIVVKIGKEYLTYGRDYLIDTNTYKSNINKGKASVVIRGIGKYGGSKTVSYTIQSKNIGW